MEKGLSNSRQQRAERLCRRECQDRCEGQNSPPGHDRRPAAANDELKLVEIRSTLPRKRCRKGILAILRHRVDAIHVHLRRIAQLVFGSPLTGCANSTSSGRRIRSVSIGATGFQHRQKKQCPFHDVIHLIEGRSYRLLRLAPRCRRFAGQYRCDSVHHGKDRAWRSWQAFRLPGRWYRRNWRVDCLPPCRPSARHNHRPGAPSHPTTSRACSYLTSILKPGNDRQSTGQGETKHGFIPPPRPFHQSPVGLSPPQG